MAVPFATVGLALFNSELDTDVAQWVWTHHTSVFVPNRLTMDYVNDLTNELATSGGYTVGGVASTASRTLFQANLWTTSRASSTAYTVNTVVRPATGNGLLYRAVVAGTSGASIPTYPTTVGLTVVDGGVTWECVGAAVVVITTPSPVWNAATFTGVRTSVLSYRAAATAAAQPLVAFFDHVTDRAGQGGAFTFNVGAQGVMHLFMP